MNIEKIATQVVDSAYQVRKELGIGLLESAYQTCLSYELRIRGFTVETEIIQPIQYKEITVESSYRIDMLVENIMIIENKTVDKILPIHIAQLITYLKMRNAPIGFLINWKEEKFQNAVKRYVNNYQEPPSQ